jgi:hypothetical protein
MNGKRSLSRVLGAAILALGLGGVFRADAQSRIQKNAVRLTVSERTIAEEKGVKQQVPRGTLQARTEEVSQVITMQRMDATLPARLTVEWLIVVETVEGRRAPADSGTREIDLPIGRPVEMVTPPVPLSGRTWRGKRGGTVKDNIVGVAVRLRKEDGTIVSESYQPKEIEPKVDDWMEQSQKPGGGPDRFRERNRLLREGALPPGLAPPAAE